MSTKEAMGPMLANNRGFAAATIVLLQNRVGRTNKMLRANPHTDFVQIFDILDQRCLLHFGQLVIYRLSSFSTPYAYQPSTYALTVSSMRAGDDSDDNAIPCLPSFAYLCGSPIRKPIRNLIRNVHCVVEIFEKEMGHNDAFVLRVHYARMFVAVAAPRITSSCAGVPPLPVGQAKRAPPLATDTPYRARSTP